MECYVVQNNPIKLAGGNSGSRPYRIAAPAGFLFGDNSMKRIPLSQGKYATVDDEDYDWLMTWNWHAKKDCKTYYAVTNIPMKHGGGQFQMHRMLLLHPEGLEIDHENHNGLFN